MKKIDDLPIGSVAVELQRRVAIESEFAAAWTKRMRMEEDPSATAAANTVQLELCAESAPQADFQARR